MITQNSLIFSINVSRWSNFYFFVQNLALWHKSCRPAYNQYWRSILSPFTDEQEKALLLFQKLRRQYPDTKSPLEHCFFKTAQPLECLNQFFPASESSAIKNVFTILQEPFTTIYQQELPKLNAWKDCLSIYFTDDVNTNNIYSILQQLYQASPQSQIHVFLLLSSPDHTGGGANIDSKSISLEISQQPTDQYAQSLGIIWHETIHLQFEKEFIHPLVREYFATPEQWSHLTEAAVASLFPRGLLAQKYFNRPLTERLCGCTPAISKQIFDLMAQYLTNYQPLDIQYFQQIDTLLKK